MTPSLGARLLIMSAYLYYYRSSPLLSDEDYDHLSKGVAKRWDKLDPFLQWQLGSVEAILATGSHIKVTMASESAAVAWYQEVMHCLPHGDPINDWKYSKRGEVHWRCVER